MLPSVHTYSRQSLFTFDVPCTCIYDTLYNGPQQPGRSPHLSSCKRNEPRDLLISHAGYLDTAAKDEWQVDRSLVVLLFGIYL